jgi:hypothetical protein
MPVRSFPFSFRATVRALIVATMSTPGAYADWRTIDLPNSASCLVHDSGLEFLPVRYQPSLAPNDLECALGGVYGVLPDANRATNKAISDIEKCIRTMQRAERFEQIQDSVQWLLRNGKTSALSSAQQMRQSVRWDSDWVRWNRQVIARCMEWLERSRSQQAVAQTTVSADVADHHAIASLVSEDYAALDGDLSNNTANIALASQQFSEVRCLGNRAFAEASPAMDAGETDTPEPPASGDSSLAILPSGLVANVFVYTLSTGDPSASSPIDSLQLIADDGDTSNRTDAWEEEVSASPVGSDFVAAFLPEAPAPAALQSSNQLEPCYPSESCFPYETQSLINSQQAGSELPYAPGNSTEASKIVSAPESFTAPDFSESSITDSELCLPLAEVYSSQCGDGLDRSAEQDSPSEQSREGNLPASALNHDDVTAVPTTPLPTQPVLTQRPDSWRGLVPFDGCILSRTWEQVNSIRFGCVESNSIPNDSPILSRPPVLELPSDEPMAYPAPSSSVATNGTVTEGASQPPEGTSTPSLFVSPTMWFGVAEASESVETPLQEEVHSRLASNVHPYDLLVSTDATNAGASTGDSGVSDVVPSIEYREYFGKIALEPYQSHFLNSDVATPDDPYGSDCESSIVASPSEPNASQTATTPIAIDPLGSRLTPDDPIGTESIGYGFE